MLNHCLQNTKGRLSFTILFLFFQFAVCFLEVKLWYRLICFINLVAAWNSSEYLTKGIRFSGEEV